MSEEPTPSRLQTGIYDLGYRSYDGRRLGRTYAVTSLFTYSLRGVFGLGRSWVAKVFAMGLAFIPMIPAFVILAIAAVTPEEVELSLNYFDFVGFGFVGTVLALFGAVTAPELIGRDERHKTLALYLSRALSRTEYVTAKLGALAFGIFIVVVTPQLLLLVGNAVATEEIVDYLGDNVGELPLILASSLLIALMVSSLTMAISCQTSRRAWATGAVIIYFSVAAALGTILLETVSSEGAGYLLLISPIHVLQGSVYWIFSDPVSVTSDVGQADLEGLYYLLAAIAYTLLGAGVVYRRYWRMAI